MSPKQYYINRIEELNTQIKVYQSKSNLFTSLRLISFLAIFLAVYIFFGSTLGIILSIFLGLTIFLFFVRKSVDIKAHLGYLKALKAINENELKVLDNDYSNFDNGVEFRNPNHPFSYDLDLFGKRSVFQFLNRTVSEKAKIKLAQFLTDGVENYQKYHATTDALQAEIEWTQKYRAVATENKKDGKKVELENWLNVSLYFPNWINIARFIFPVIAILATVLYAINILPSNYYGLVVALCLLPILNQLKNTNQIAMQVGLLKDRLKALNSQIHLFEELKADSEQIAEMKKVLFDGDENAKEAFAELSKQIDRFDMRLNIVVSVLLNLFISYDFQLIILLKKWRDKYEANILEWESKLVEMEVVISMVNYKFNSEKPTYPKLSNDNNAPINIENLGHPLLLFKPMVANNYSMKKENRFSIITGPNMAGKSTFLRSVGINLIMARAGFAVVADSFSFPDLKLYSSMRTADDLNEESSYFHAELTRLRFIVDAVDRGEKVFIILDEILKGTNSKDKEEGSAKFLNKLVQLGTRGIIATHDLSLTKLAENNDAIKNHFFDSTITGDNISFSYSISDGVVQNMNASFLLKQMQLV